MGYREGNIEIVAQKRQKTPEKPHNANPSLEGSGFRGVGFGEALDFYQTDISIQGPNPVSPSGGNIGSGRSRFWMHTDCIQQIQGRAGARQITGITAEVGVSGGPMPLGGNFTVWGEAPD